VLLFFSLYKLPGVVKNPRAPAVTAKYTNCPGFKKKEKASIEAVAPMKEISKKSLYFLVLSTRGPNRPAPTRPMTTTSAPMMLVSF
jgi:hypothetical protein